MEKMKRKFVVAGAPRVIPGSSREWKETAARIGYHVDVFADRINRRRRGQEDKERSTSQGLTLKGALRGRILLCAHASLCR